MVLITMESNGLTDKTDKTPLLNPFIHVIRWTLLSESGFSGFTGFSGLKPN